MSNTIYKPTIIDEWQKVAGLIPEQNPLHIAEKAAKIFPDKVFMWATDDKIDNGNHIVMLMGQEGTNWQFAPEDWVSTDPGAKDKIFVPTYENRGVGRVYFAGSVLMWTDRKKYEARKKALARIVDARKRVVLQAKKSDDVVEEFGSLGETEYKPPVVMKE